MNPDIELQKQEKRFAEWLKKHKLQDLNPIKSKEVQLERLLPLCFEERSDKLSLNASWLLEKYIKAFPEHADRIVPHVVSQLEHVRIEGSQRILGNILIETLKKKNNYDLSDQEEEIVIETTFNWLITPQKAVAVIANCFEVLGYLSDKHPWVKDELVAQIDFFIREGASVAVQARGKKTLKRLKTVAAIQARKKKLLEKLKKNT